jgi:hypothetical protein
MFLIYLDESWDKKSLEERRSAYDAQARANERLAPGQYLGGSPLQPTSSATSVRVRDGKRLLTDGPFAETREHLGGYMLIDFEHAEAAIAFAEVCPLAHVGTIEVRPLREGPPT